MLPSARLPRVVLGLTALGFAALFSCSARAANPPKPPPANAAIQVYIEQIPTASGSVAAGASNNSGRGLTPKIKKQLDVDGGLDAAWLESAATSSGYGAPQAPLESTVGSPGLGGSNWRAIALPAALLALALGAVALRVSARPRRDAG
jgi:hypothetical protein